MATGKGFHTHDSKSKRSERKLDVMGWVTIFMAPGATRDPKGRKTVKVCLQPYVPLIQLSHIPLPSPSRNHLYCFILSYQSFPWWKMQGNTKMDFYMYALSYAKTYSIFTTLHLALFIPWYTLLIFPNKQIELISDILLQWCAIINLISTFFWNFSLFSIIFSHKYIRNATDDLKQYLDIALRRITFSFRKQASQEVL